MKKRSAASYSAIVLIGIIGLALVGCSSPPKATYSSVEELRVAFEDAGGSCPDWTQDNAVEDATESGNCGARTVLMVFDTASEARTRANNPSQMLSAFGMDVNLLLGENWLVNSPDAAIVETKLGGELIIE